MLSTVEQTARSAAWAWRRARGIEGGLIGLSIGLVAVALSALWIEFHGGLHSADLWFVLAWLLVAPLGVIVGLSRGVALTAAAAEADLRAGLFDRLGTALEFAGDPSPLAALQRSDAAASAQGLATGALFPVPWGNHLPRLTLLLVLALASTGISLTFQLRPTPTAAVEPDLDDDLLAAIDRNIDAYQERGDKEAVRLLTDLDRTIRRIRAREQELRKVVKARAPKPSADTPDPEREELPELPPQPEYDAPRITADDLARLEEETIDQLAMTDAQQAAIVSDLFSHSRKASDLMEEFHHIAGHEAEATAQSATAATRNTSTGQDSTSGMMDNSDLVGNSGLDRDATKGATRDIADEREDMIRRDLSDESQAAHDRAHDTQESFNQFLREFVKDVQDIVAEAAVGKSKKDGKAGKKDESRQVQVNPGEGVEDKADAMASNGFEEMDATKRHSDQSAPEDLSGQTQAAQGPPPDGAQMSQGSGSPKGPRMKGDGQGETSAGAEGAGTGGKSPNEGLSTLLNGLKPQAGGRLEQALGQLAKGKMPPETRDVLFDRLARHKVHAGLASEADDVLVDYFADAEELMVANSDSLPPLFRDYAQSYFDSIRPGAALRANEGR